MTIYNTIKEKLEADLSFRERRFRDEGLVQLVLEKNGKGSQMFVDTNFLKDFAKDYVSYERIWRDVLKHEKDLRGSDYKDGEILSDEFEINVLGREVSYPHDVKMGARFTS